jgi:hypothetical protein
MKVLLHFHNLDRADQIKNYLIDAVNDLQVAITDDYENALLFLAKDPTFQVVIAEFSKAEEGINEFTADIAEVSPAINIIVMTPKMERSYLKKDELSSGVSIINFSDESNQKVLENIISPPFLPLSAAQKLISIAIDVLRKEIVSPADVYFQQSGRLMKLFNCGEEVNKRKVEKLEEKTNTVYYRHAPNDFYNHFPQHYLFDKDIFKKGYDAIEVLMESGSSKLYIQRLRKMLDTGDPLGLKRNAYDYELVHIKYKDDLNKPFKELIQASNFQKDMKKTSQVFMNYFRFVIHNFFLDPGKKSLQTIQMATQGLSAVGSSSDIYLNLYNSLQVNSLVDHSIRVGILSVLVMLETINKENEESSEQYKLNVFLNRSFKKENGIFNDFLLASALHDYGMYHLVEQGAHTDVQIRQNLHKIHSQQTIEFLDGILVNKEVIALILNHEEMCDGSGFPSGKNKNDLSIMDQIFTLANAYDNLVFKDGIRVERALDILKTSAKYSEYFVKVLAEVIEESRIID